MACLDSGKRSKRYGPRRAGQRCWVHKTANVLNKLPKRQQPKAKRALQEIWMAETKKDALAAFDAFVEAWGVKYDKAAECLIKDRDVLSPSTTSRPSTGSICARRMRWTSDFFMTETTIAEIAVRPFFCSAAPRAILPSRPSISQPPRAGAVKAGRICGHLQGLALTASSTTARWRGTGLHSWRGWNLPSATIMVVGRGRPRGEA